MGKKVYVGNLSFLMADHDLHSLFETHGTVKSAWVILDPATGRSKGFGFVEMRSGAQASIAALNGQEVNGRAITVSETIPRGMPRGSPAGVAAGRHGCCGTRPN